MSMRNKKKFTFIDLFAGIGGFHLAFHNNGAECVFASEWNDYARKTYEANFRKISPGIFNDGKFAGDVLNIDRPTGGYSLQVGWTTGFVAGENV